MKNTTWQRSLLGAGILALIVSVSITTVSAKDASQYPADNTGKNVRDQGGKTLTPQDQPDNQQDKTVTQRVRQLMQQDKSLSVNAQNVKIITVNGQVTLRGPVDSKAEKASVYNKARQIAGLENVNNQLEVVP